MKEEILIAIIAVVGPIVTGVLGLWAEMGRRRYKSVVEEMTSARSESSVAQESLVKTLNNVIQESANRIEKLEGVQRALETEHMKALQDLARFIEILPVMVKTEASTTRGAVQIEGGRTVERLNDSERRILSELRSAK